ncbi:MAG: helix-hairpin-helix domain-containing protein [Anaerovoracaceae bacterium]|jgi:competence protein ComEA
MKSILSKEYIIENKKTVLKRCIIVAIAVTALFVFLFRTGQPDDLKVNKADIKSKAHASQSQQVETTIIVDISGQVRSPQVVELKSGARISDAIESAGGLTAKADISNINRAAKVKDGEKIYIPARGEKDTAAAGSSGTAVQPSGETTADQSTSAQTSGPGAVTKVNINSASSSELQTLNGVGPATAEKILLYRSQNGGFKSIEDLMNVNGIGEKTFEKLKPYITI